MAGRYYVLGMLLIAVGFAGFLLSSPLLGVLEVSPALNIIHLVAGAATIAAAVRGLGAMRTWGKLLGFIFLVSAIVAFAVDGGPLAGLLPLTDSNAWAHLAIALAYLYHALLAPPTL
jgi:hypothetical protein